MSQLTTASDTSDLTHLAKLSVSIRGKLQFMDYLVRAAVADVDRFREETDAGTRIFIRQLIEMHASNLSVESENMRLIGELCNALEAVVHDEDGDGHGSSNGLGVVHDSLRNGDSE